MMMAIGLSQYNVALMHTVNHAFFKALLFLGAGAVIHSFADQQDVRKMGGLIKFLPFTYSVMLTGSLSLLATPYLTGFYSKDLILELAYGQYNFSGIYAYILGSITAGISAFYSFRLISLVFLTTPNGNKQSYINSCLPPLPPLGKAHSSSSDPSSLPKGSSFATRPFFNPLFIKKEGKNKNGRGGLLSRVQWRAEGASLPPQEQDRPFGRAAVELEKLNLIVIFPLLSLALFSIFFGFVFSDLFVGMGSDFFQNSIFMHPKNISLIEAEFSLVLQGQPFPFGGGSTDPAQAGVGPSLMGHAKAGYGELQSNNNIFIKLLPAILSFTGAFSAIILYHLQLPASGVGLILNNLTNNKIVAFGAASPASQRGRNIYAFLNGKYYFDVIYNHFFIQSGLKLGYNISKEIDRGAIELLGPYGLSNYFYNAGKNLAKLDTGVITTYSLYITIALISLLFILFSPALALATDLLPSQRGPGGGVSNPGSLEEIRLFIIYITSALIVLSPYPPVTLRVQREGKD